jgi:DNA-directed RNA polymerase subunit E'/Rpb7
MENNFFETILEDNIKLSPKLLNNNYEKHITNLLKKKYEGICSRHGYIKKNSIKIINTGYGKIEMHSFHGYVIFNVKYQALVCNPTIGSIIECNVKNMNDFGILCNAGLIENGEFTHVIDVIILKNSQNINTNVELLKNIKVNDVIHVEIIGKKYNINNKRISAIGKVENSHQNKVSLDKEDEQEQPIEDGELDNNDSDVEEDEESENEDEDDKEDELEEDDDFEDDFEEQEMSDSDKDSA